MVETDLNVTVNTVSKKPEFNFSLDILNTIACLMVVYFHCNGLFYTFSDTLSWKVSLFIRCIVCSAIPVFFMLTGAHLITYRDRYSTSEYIKKRLIRTGIPFLFWNAFYILYYFLLLKKSVKSVSEFLSLLLTSGFQGRYWFFFPLFAVYAAIPVISYMLKLPNHRKIFWYIVGITFLSSWLLKTVCLLSGISYNFDIAFPLGGGYIMYVIFGYLVATEKWQKKYRYILYSANIVTFVANLIITYKLSADAGETYKLFVSYEIAPAALMGASIFVFFNNMNTEKVSPKIKNLFRTLASCNMGVWLTHSLCIILVSKVLSLNSESYIFRLICPVIIYILCVFGTWVVKKIPYLKYIV